MVLTKLFKEVVDPALHSRICGLAAKGFGTTTPVNIITNLQRLYGRLRYQELDAALLCLNETMKLIQWVEVMLIVIEEVQLFLLSNPDKDRALTEPDLIIYALIKLTKTGGVYSKGKEKW